MLPETLANKPNLAWLKQLKPLAREEVRQRKNETSFERPDSEYKLTREQVEALDAEARDLMAEGSAEN